MRVERIGNATLYLGDCRELLPAMKADAIITDPPYGIGMAKAKAHSSIAQNERWPALSWDDAKVEREVLTLALRAGGGRGAIWGGNYYADLLPASSGWLIWRKPEAETGFSLADAELCWTSEQFAARIRTYARRDGNDHPTQKPVEIMTWTLSFVPGESVIDPFMGSGTTGVACASLGRSFVGIEIHEPYFRCACERIENAQRQERLFA